MNAPPAPGPLESFHSPHYLRHNARRLEHLASLRIPVAGLSVLEVGAGIGDHSHYYIDRGCRILVTEARQENLQLMRARMAGCDIAFLDMNAPALDRSMPFDVVHCYGLLYHLHEPEKALEFMSAYCRRMLFLETCVSFGDGADVNLTGEDTANLTQATSGTGCRPTRRWIFEKLKQLFPCAYVPRTQPNHGEFPIDWTAPHLHRAPLSRAVFIASRAPIENDMLSGELLDLQQRHP